MSHLDNQLTALVDWLSANPTVAADDTPSRGIGRGSDGDGNWWVKFTIDISHPQAWVAVQVMGFTLNYLSLEERLDTVFKPVSPPPYLNGGPTEYLSWVIEGGPHADPKAVANHLEAEFSWLRGFGGEGSLD